MERMASGFRNEVNNLTVGKISAEEAKRREQISQQERREAFEKSKKIKRPANHEKLLIKIKKQEAEKKKQRYERNLKKFAKMADRRGKTLKF